MGGALQHAAFDTRYDKPEDTDFRLKNDSPISRTGPLPSGWLVSQRKAPGPAKPRFQFTYRPLETEVDSQRIFADPRNIRHIRVFRKFAVAVCFVTVWLAVFLHGLSSDRNAVSSTAEKYASPSQLASTPVSGFVPATAYSSEDTALDGCTPNTPAAFSAMAKENSKRIFAHLPVTTEWTHLSLDQSCGKVSVLLPEWLNVQEAKDSFQVVLASADARLPIDDFLADVQPKPDILPVVNFPPWSDAAGFSSRLEQQDQRRALITDLMRSLRQVEADGACVSLAALSNADLTGLSKFLEEFERELDAQELQSCIIVNAEDGIWRKPGFAAGYDHIILKAFFEPWTGSAPSPLAPNAWFKQVLSEARSAIGIDRLVVALGTASASWTSGKPTPEKISFAEAHLRVSGAGADLHFSAEASGSFSAFRDASGRRQTLWMLDAASTYNQIRMLEEAEIPALAIWSLGQEDPGLWDILVDQHWAAGPLEATLQSVKFDNYVHYVGEGAFLRILERPQVGQRSVSVDAQTGRIVDQTYEIAPAPYVVERYGKPDALEIILTFDDGPHPEYTRDILNILRENDVPGVFFLLGRNVMAYPDIARRILDENHEIGAHSFSHPRMDLVSVKRFDMELTLSSRVIASATGRDTILYREPFLRSGGPIVPSRVGPLEAVQRTGAIISGMDVVPKDWTGLTSDQILSYVLSEIECGAGNIILLHDGGNDRSETVAALPAIIKELRARGYVFKSMSDVLGIDRDALMPTVSGVQPVFDRVSFSAASAAQSLLMAAFWIVLVIGLFRSSAILLLAALRRRHRPPPLGRLPKVAVVIPAFNEEKVIGRCISSVLASDYENLEIIVVDDGSTDKTLHEIFAYKHKTKVRLISQPNQGKWSALNRAVLSLDAEIAVCIDADTQVDPHAVTALVSHFANAKVGAVAGKISVGNRTNILTRLQALEYVTAQNVERRAFDFLNGIIVVPGAIGAWRVSALRKVRLYCQDTLTEDSDATIALNRAGYRIIYDETAIAYTEVPESIKSLMSQRLRWSLGMFQSAWKHKRAVLERRSVGLVSIPDMLVFGYLFPLLAPIADLLFLTLLYSALVGGWTGDVGSHSWMIDPDLAWAYLALPALEFVIATVAVSLDRRESKFLILLFPIQRMFYRPLLYLSVFRALFRALSGQLAAWGQIQRQGHDRILLEKLT